MDNENESQEIVKIIQLECEASGVQTTSNAGASKKTAEMGVLHTSPDNANIEMRSLQRQVYFLASDKDVFEIQRNGKVVAFCNICTTTIATGEAHQGLFCIRQH